MDSQLLLSKMGELEKLLLPLLHNPDNAVSYNHLLLSHQKNAEQVVSHHICIPDHHLDELKRLLSTDLASTHSETASLSNEIDTLHHSYLHGTSQLELNLHSLRYSLSQAQNGNQPQSTPPLPNSHLHHFQMMDLKHKIHNNNATLYSLTHLHLTSKWLDAVEQMEEAVTGLKVKLIDFDNNSIRVSLTTCIPAIQGMGKQSEVKHELLIQLMNGTSELINAQLIPNDVDIGEVVEAAKDYSSNLFSTQRAFLGWFLQKVQERIVVSTTKKLTMKNASN